MRARTSRESLAISSALLFTLGASTPRESSRVLPAGEAPQVHGVDQEVGNDRPEEVAAQLHEAAEQQPGDQGEQGPEAERAAGAGVEKSEHEGRRQPAEAPLDGAAEEQLLG